MRNVIGQTTLLVNTSVLVERDDLVVIVVALHFKVFHRRPCQLFNTFFENYKRKIYQTSLILKYHPCRLVSVNTYMFPSSIPHYIPSN